MTQVTAIPPRELDHRHECVGCGAHFSDPDAPSCPFETGEFGPAVILRAAAGRLTDRPAGIGCDINGALFATALEFVGRENAWEATTKASDALAEYQAQLGGEPARAIRDQLVYRLGLFATNDEITVSLYGAAALHDDIDFDPDDVL
jgi:hypothetical protein